jgi:glycosyltransferase involved in cell wall biosynthesis
MKVVVMVSMSPLKFDSRIDREASSLVDAGYKVYVLGLGPIPENRPWIPIQVGVASASKSSTRNRSSVFWRVLKYLSLVPYRYMKRKKFVQRVRELITGFAVIDILHAHDLPALEATKPFHKKLLLVYDSHELWTGRNLRGLGSRFELSRDQRIEAVGVQCASAVITVSDQLAEVLAIKFGREVAVVRNTFAISNEDPPEGVSYLAYAGNISAGRDLPTVIDGASVARTEIRLMGRNISDFILQSPSLVFDHGTVEEAGTFLRDGGIAVVSLESGIENHLRALPNKLLQAIAEGVPVVASNLPTIAHIVRSNNLGELYESGDSESFAQAVRRVRDNYPSYVENVLKARKVLHWSIDSEILLGIYENILPEQ